MKKAVKHLEKFLERIEGYTKGKVVLATVYGDVHDIGKSLVNTILSNNGYTVFDLGKQVPVNTIIDAAQENGATRSACRRCSSRRRSRCRCACRSWTSADSVPGADRRRGDQPRLRPPHPLPARQGVRRASTSRASSTARTRSRAWRRWTSSSTRRRAPRSSTKIRARRPELREKAGRGRRRPADRPTTRVRSAARTDMPVPSRRSGACARSTVDLDEVYPHLDTHVLFKLHWGGRGVKGEDWRELVERGLPAAAGAHVARAGLPAPARAARLLPVQRRRQRGRRASTRTTARRELERLVFPRQPRHDRICLADFYRPLDSGERDVVALQAVTVGDEVTELMAQLEADGEFAEQLFVHGLGVQTAEGMAEWLHAQVRARSRHRPRPGPPLLVGLPGRARTSPSTRRSSPARRADDRPAPVAAATRVEPEQSTVAIVAHHPQAVYFGMKSGFLPKDERRATPTTRSPATDRDADARAPRADDGAPRRRAGDQPKEKPHG